MAQGFGLNVFNAIEWVYQLGEPFAPIRDRRFVRGLYRWENRWLHVSAGVGSLHTARFNCRPEIAIITVNP